MSKPNVANGWTELEEEKLWRKNNVFVRVDRVVTNRSMTMAFGQDAGKRMPLADRIVWAHSGTDPRETVTIEYTNHRGERQTYPALIATLRNVGEHISFKVPTERERLSLAKSRINNAGDLPAIPNRYELREILPHLRRGTSRPAYETMAMTYPAFAPPLPSSYEQQVLTYHQRRGSTSARCEELKAKYTPGAPAAAPPTPAVLEETTTEELPPVVEPEPVPAEMTGGTVSVVLTGCGLATFEATNVLKELRPDLGAFDLYQLLRNFPQTVAADVAADKAVEYQQRLEAAGCKVELR